MHSHQLLRPPERMLCSWAATPPRVEACANNGMLTSYELAQDFAIINSIYRIGRFSMATFDCPRVMNGLMM